MSAITVISSTQNDFVKMVRSLHEKKGRMEHQAFLVEGEKCVRELLEHAPKIIKTLIVTAGNQMSAEIQAAARVQSVVTVEPHVMKSLCECKTPQYVAAVAQLPVETVIGDGFIVALDDVTDPANVGTIIRTADAAGCAGVLLSSGSADPFSPKAVRSSMGSLFHLPVIRTDLRDQLAALLQRGYHIACGELMGSAEFSLNPDTTCLVIGNESRGISEEIMELATVRIRIPIYGKAESLNAAVAAGILMYKIRT